MLTLRTYGYHDEQLNVMRDALCAAYDEIMSTGDCRNSDHYDCHNCPIRIPCADMARTIAYIETELMK